MPPHNNLLKEVLLLSSFYRSGNGGTEPLSDLPGITQQRVVSWDFSPRNHSGARAGQIGTAPQPRADRPCPAELWASTVPRMKGALPWEKTSRATYVSVLRAGLRFGVSLSLLWGWGTQMTLGTQRLWSQTSQIPSCVALDKSCPSLSLFLHLQKGIGNRSYLWYCWGIN